MTDTDTSAEEISAVIRGLRPMNGASQMDDGVALIVALASERDEWKGGFGHFLSAIPLGDVIAASGTVQDAIDYFKGVIAERDALRLEVASARKALTAIEDMGKDLKGAKMATLKIGLSFLCDTASDTLKTNGDNET